jgi:hypothetical protein
MVNVYERVVRGGVFQDDRQRISSFFRSTSPGSKPDFLVQHEFDTLHVLAQNSLEEPPSPFETMAAAVALISQLLPDSRRENDMREEWIDAYLDYALPPLPEEEAVATTWLRSLNQLQLLPLMRPGILIDVAHDPYPAGELFAKRIEPKPDDYINVREEVQMRFGQWDKGMKINNTIVDYDLKWLKPKMAAISHYAHRLVEYDLTQELLEYAEYFQQNYHNRPGYYRQTVAMSLAALDLPLIQEHEDLLLKRGLNALRQILFGLYVINKEDNNIFVWGNRGKR